MKKGFTLAEVLITLVIIGVIAAMTIPTLMNKTNEQETVTAVKKAYSVLGQAYQKVIAENGEIIPSELGNASEAIRKFGDLLVKHLSVTGTGDYVNNANDDLYTFFDGSGQFGWNTSADAYYKIRLNDGMSIRMYVYNDYVIIGNTNRMKTCFGYFLVDVNGDKGPNIIGKDTFQFDLMKNGILPAGLPDDLNRPLSDCRGQGFGCAAWVITKGNMDYLRKDVSW